MGTSIQRYSVDYLQPSRDMRLAVKRAIKLKVSSTFAKAAILAEKTGTNEVQNLLFGGTGGTSTFTLTFGAATTSAISWSATGATLIARVQAALDALSTVGTGNSLVADVDLSSGLGNISVTFQNALGSTNVAAMTAAIVSGSLTVTPTTTTAGVAGSNNLFDAYNSGGSDGTQTAKCILPFACTTNAAGDITIGDGSSGGDYGTTYPSIWAWFGGYFFSVDVPALTTGILSSLGGRMVAGSIAARGEFKF